MRRRRRRRGRGGGHDLGALVPCLRGSVSFFLHQLQLLLLPREAAAYDAHMSDETVTDPLTVGLYADPNCTKSEFWTGILKQLNGIADAGEDAESRPEEGVRGAGVPGGDYENDSEDQFLDEVRAGASQLPRSADHSTEHKISASNSTAFTPPNNDYDHMLPDYANFSPAQLHQGRINLAGFFMRQYGLDTLLNHDDPCLLGAYSLFLFNIWNSWNGGSFHGTLINFAMLNDGFLEGMTPQFYEHSVWPLKDHELRVLRAQILYNVRKYRTYFLTSNATASDEDGGQVYRDELRRQLQQRARRGLVDVPHWEVTPYHAYTGSVISNVPQTKIRIYVYDDGFSPQIGKLTTGASFCHRRQWGSDVGFYDFFRQAPEMTKDPEEADYFFVPGFALCLQVAGVYSLEQLDEIYKQLVRDLPYFERNGGRDHIFTFHYQDVFFSWRSYIPHAIFLTPETEVGFELSVRELGYDPEREKVFDTRKDIVTPPYMDFKHVIGLIQYAKPMRQRQVFASFAGKLWADVEEAFFVRNGMKEAFAEQCPFPECKIHAENSMSELLNSRQMYSLMGDSKFCLVPRGRAAWSVRFFETMWAGCIPVILSDHFETPFEALFDVTKFVIKWPVAKMGGLYGYLKSIPVWKLERMQGEATRVRCWYLYTQPEISMLGSANVLHTQHNLENVCPNLGSSRNAYQAVLELLARKVRKSKTLGRFYYPKGGGGAEDVGGWMTTKVVDMEDPEKDLGPGLSAESGALSPISR